MEPEEIVDGEVIATRTNGHKDEAEVPAAPPFPITLHFKNGSHFTFWVTRFEPQYGPFGDKTRITGGLFEQAPPRVVGDMQLVWVDWSEVQMITSEAMEEPE